jgi:ATP synthase protein I
MARAPRSPGGAWGGAFEGALEAGLSVAIGAGAGYCADRWLGTFPFFLIALLIAGGIAGVRRLMRIPWSAPSREANHEPPDPRKSGPRDRPEDED